MTPDRTPIAVTVAVAALGLVSGILLWRVLAILGLQIPLDPNEGWNAYHTAALMQGAPLYPSAQSYLVNNYPPVSFYLVGALGRTMGDYVIAGRAVSLIAFVFVCFGIGLAALRLGATWVHAAFAALLFAGGMLSFTDYVGMDDPQMLAHALAMAGFLVLLNAPSRWQNAIGAGALFVLAGFVKHNVIVMAGAAVLWLPIYERKTAWIFIAAGLAFLCAGLVLFRIAYGVGLLSVLDSARSYSLALLLDGGGQWLCWNGVALAGLVAVVSIRRSRAVLLCALYSVCGIAVGGFFLGGAGVDTNAMFDADIALAITAALVLQTIHKTVWRGIAAAALALPVLAGGFAYASEIGLDEIFSLHPGRYDAGVAASDIAFLKARPGPALCQMLSFCYWADKSAEVDFFNTGERFATGVRRDRDLVSRIEARAFAVIQFDPGQSAALGEGVRAAVRKVYRLDHADDVGEFYVPAVSARP
jgi:hypothetical protein